MIHGTGPVLTRAAGRGLPDLSPLGLQQLATLDLTGQHPMRRWEYGMALTALETWEAEQPPCAADTNGDRNCGQRHCLTCRRNFIDVGGAGSPFSTLLPKDAQIMVLDPALPDAQTQRRGDSGLLTLVDLTVEQYCLQNGPAVDPPYTDAIFCLSVLEHVPEPRTTLRAMCSLLRPGGLLFLTVDYWNSEGPDTAHFHWMRHRIYNEESLKRLLEDGRTFGLRRFGASDWTYHGPTVYDYSFFAAALVKRQPEERT